MLLAWETVHADQVLDPEAHHYVTHDLVDLDQASLRWLHEATGAMLAVLEPVPSIDGVPLAEVLDIPSPSSMADTKPTRKP
jgi:hypothetical protein